MIFTDEVLHIDTQLLMNKITKLYNRIYSLATNFIDQEFNIYDVSEYIYNNLKHEYNIDDNLEIKFKQVIQKIVIKFKYDRNDFNYSHPNQWNTPHY